MLKSSTHAHGLAKARLLAAQNPHIPADADAARRFVYNTENWVRMWIDPDHAVTSDCGKVSAYRGVSLKGQLMWMVRHQDRRHGYHSHRQLGDDAIQEAQWAWAERRRVRRRWDDVRAVQRDLLLGRRRLRVTRADAYRSALCPAGIDAFMERIGCRSRDGLNGRLAALLMYVEPQLGFAIFAAHEHALAMRSVNADPIYARVTG